jgi:signal transduction histidine kinase
MLTVLTMELRSAKTLAISCNPFVPALGAALERAYASARQAIDELRRSVMDLYPSMLDDLGIVASLSAILREAREAYPRMRIDADITVSDAQVPAALRIVAFRVVQEAVNNALKHSGAQFLNVIFSCKNDFLALSIVDDGQGIATKILQELRHCSGVSGMVRRVRASGGEIEISSVVGSGTRIAVTWNTVSLRQ